MSDQLRSLNTTAFTMLVFEFADLEGVNKAELEEKMRCPVVELFDKQKNADRAKRLLKSDFDKAVAIYFNNYQTSTGFAFDRLAKKLDECNKIFVRHLGKDKVSYLRLLINIAKLIQEKPKGLLGVA
jgi:hypothetical protein